MGKVTAGFVVIWVGDMVLSTMLQCRRAKTLETDLIIRSNEVKVWRDKERKRRQANDNLNRSIAELRRKNTLLWSLLLEGKSPEEKKATKMHVQRTLYPEGGDQ